MTKARRLEVMSRLPIASTGAPDRGPSERPRRAPPATILLIEPDFLPVSVAEPRGVREFWDGRLAWARAARAPR
jgi:hypothetical protein